MSFNSLMNHRARVWRPTQERGNHAEVLKAFSEVTQPSGLNARPAPIDWKTADPGGGEGSGYTGTRRWFMRANADVRQFDVLEFSEGPESQRRIRVLDASFPHSHHYMLVVEPYLGDLPSDEEP